MNFKHRALDVLKEMPFISDVAGTAEEWRDFYHADKFEKAGLLIPAISIPLISLGIGYGIHKYRKKKKRR